MGPEPICKLQSSYTYIMIHVHGYIYSYIHTYRLIHVCLYIHTLNSAYNKVAFNEKLPITKENLSTKYTPFTYKYIALNKKPLIMKQNLCIFFFHYRQSSVYIHTHFPHAYLNIGIQANMHTHTCMIQT